MAACLIGCGDVEIGLANAEVYGILQRAAQLEYLANPRDLDGAHPLGDPVSLHIYAFISTDIPAESGFTLPVGKRRDGGL